MWNEMITAWEIHQYGYAIFCGSFCAFAWGLIGWVALRSAWLCLRPLTPRHRP